MVTNNQRDAWKSPQPFFQLEVSCQEKATLGINLHLIHKTNTHSPVEEKRRLKKPMHTKQKEKKRERERRGSRTKPEAENTQCPNPPHVRPHDAIVFLPCAVLFHGAPSRADTHTQRHTEPNRRHRKARGAVARRQPPEGGLHKNTL